MSDEFWSIGTLVKVVGNYSGHGFKQGDILEIKNVDSEDTFLTYYLKHSNKKMGWWTSPTDIVPYANKPGEDCIF